MVLRARSRNVIDEPHCNGVSGMVDPRLLRTVDDVLIPNADAPAVPARATMTFLTCPHQAGEDPILGLEILRDRRVTYSAEGGWLRLAPGS